MISGMQAVVRTAWCSRKMKKEAEAKANAAMDKVKKDAEQKAKDALKNINPFKK